MFDMCFCLWLILTILRWPCASDRMLKSNYWLFLSVPFLSCLSPPPPPKSLNKWIMCWYILCYVSLSNRDCTVWQWSHGWGEVEAEPRFLWWQVVQAPHHHKPRLVITGMLHQSASEGIPYRSMPQCCHMHIQTPLIATFVRCIFVAFV